MKRKLTFAAKLGSLAMLILLGCSKSPVELAQRIATADRVVLRNYYYSSPGVVVTNYYHSSPGDEFTGLEAEKIVHAVSKSKGKRITAAVSSIPGPCLQFYRGTNLLAQVEGDGMWFHIGNVSYHDWSGVLQTASQTVYEKEDR